ncbi:MAG: hypothetical protein RR739_06665, partial [Clostridia bacterium]
MAAFGVSGVSGASGASGVSDAVILRGAELNKNKNDIGTGRRRAYERDVDGWQGVVGQGL